MTDTLAHRPPRPEYPRPDRDRSARWLTLNGTWDLDSADGPTTIVVPFAWETAASGVQRTWLERATYRRQFTVPQEWADARVFLCFGAVHHQARVLVNGRAVTEHVGGSTPFEVDLTDLVPAGAGARLEVEVTAPADKRSIPHGKQRSIPRDDYDGVSFTPTSGIWQTVWLEARGRTYVEASAIRGDSMTGFDVSGRLAGDAPAGHRVVVRVVEGASGAEPQALELVADADGRFAGRLEVPGPRLWSPASPHLYRLELATTGGDRVVVTAGLRRFEARGEHLYLNGERCYLRGVLDQGYWPASGLTAPDDAALVADLELARAAGYNLVRKHIKLEEPAWLHHADRLGVLVWAEPPGPSRFSPQAARGFEEQLAAMVERDGNHPSIVIWGLYNEEWGLDWDIPGSPERVDAARRAYVLLRELDDTRPIVENSGWNHVRTDLVDWHYYDEDPAAWARNVASLADGSRETFPVKLGPSFTVAKSLYGTADHPRSGLPILNSEYGAGFTSLERAWHLRWQTQELRRHDRFAGYVYTEFADVEHEMAGFVDADRRPKDLGGLDLADVNAETVLVLDVVPIAAGADIPMPTGELEVSVRLSHHGPESLSGRVRAEWLPAGTPLRAATYVHRVESEPLKAQPFEVSAPVRIVVPSPGEGRSAARLHLWFVDEMTTVRAQTFVDAAPIEAPNRRGATAL